MKELKELLNDKVYAIEVELDSKKLAKIGYTTHKDMQKLELHLLNLLEN